MNNLLIAYNISELEKKIVSSEARRLYKSKFINEDQWNRIKQDYSSNLFTPTIFMKILLFILSYIGLSTIMGPMALLFGNIGQDGYQILSLVFGLSLIIFTEKILIKDKLHYKSGVTEAGIYAGLSFIAFGLLGSGPDLVLIYPIVGFILAGFASVRYLNLIALVLTMIFFSWILFQILSDIGGVAEAITPFVFMTVFGLIYYFSIKIQEKLSSVIFDTQFTIIKTIALIISYLAVNYFVVREVSIEWMNLNLAENEDIPFAFIFYILTALIPIGYIALGLKNRSILLIRVGLLAIALSVFTFKYYFSLGFPMISVTIAGALLIVIALLLFNYLKKSRNGYTRENFCMKN